LLFCKVIDSAVWIGNIWFIEQEFISIASKMADFVSNIKLLLNLH